MPPTPGGIDGGGPLGFRGATFTLYRFSSRPDPSSSSNFASQFLTFHGADNAAIPHNSLLTCDRLI